MLAPKVLGVANLDQNAADLTLRLHGVFGSAPERSANVGQAVTRHNNPGVLYRNELVSRATVWRTIDRAWPLWRDGGQIDAALLRSMGAGIRPLGGGGLQAFYHALSSGKAEADSIRSEAVAEARVE